MKNPKWRRNLAGRLPKPAQGNGRLQQMAWHLLRALGPVTTLELIGDAYADRLLLGGERRHDWFNRRCRTALEAVGAVRTGRAKTIGRPWIWALPERSSGKDH
jgi:hypothetical protein